ncbi:ABC transporter ATP-binding protein [Acuticoccus sp. MNP-M23]|uniref:ABC transporter ATP-binding protein n=1 Tax=Acuticoccus sp. MNP-M23 TaxID=3072793 RepID=UPI0028154987|nr:ABC transporter ATP-binding protein [Acuticoccus sp. MNP-M23]WMS40899.1 ABC transporter ATP-binding protein [Acuticoccus sp. MNP-M23]
MADIVVKNLSKKFGTFTAVHASSFTVHDGEFFMLLGPSGCGKTTSLRMIAGLELPTEGEIWLDGEEVSGRPARERDIAFVFQMFALYPHMNVRRNLSYSLVSQGWRRSRVKERVGEVARILKIEGILDRPVGGLSAGDRQRVALGRAIVREPKAFMMDEPLGALDTEFREHMAEELRALHDRIGATTVYVTHDQLEAMQMGDRIAVMNQGVVEQIGKPQEVYDHPATMFVASFLGSPAMAFLPFEGTVAPGAATVRVAGADIALPALREGASGRIVLGVRPEHVTLANEGAIRGEVLASEYLGMEEVVTVRTAYGDIRARTAPDRFARVGEPVGLSFDAAALSLFDEASGRAFLTEANEAVLTGGAHG